MGRENIIFSEKSWIVRIIARFDEMYIYLVYFILRRQTGITVKKRYFRENIASGF